MAPVSGACVMGIMEHIKKSNYFLFGQPSGRNKMYFAW